MKAIQQLERDIEEVRTAATGILGNSGPKTVAGKQRVALNGVTHGLTGQNVFLEANEYPAYMRLGAQFISELRPVGVRETQLAQKIIDINWRLNSISAVENNLFNTTLVNSLRPNDSNDDRTIGMVAKATAWRTDCEGANAFEKLGRYESRLQRAQFRMTEEFERIQTIRLKNGNDTFDLATCNAWLWYDRMLTLNAELTSARLAEAEAVRRSTTESTASAAELLCKNTVSQNLATFAAGSSFVPYSLDSGGLPQDQTGTNEKGSRRSETLLKANTNKAGN